MSELCGTLPQWDTAPMDYCLVLDAVMPRLTGDELPLVRCSVPALAAEIRQRLPRWAETGPVRSALWVEPMAGSWQAVLDALSVELEMASALYVVASRPLARLLPERQEWPGDPLGLQFRGLRRLQQAMRDHGFVLEGEYGVHSMKAISLNLIGGLVSRWGRPDVADRLGFAARLHYCTTGSLALLSTVAVFLARRSGL